MRCKALQVIVELELQAITCPGVWLCPAGYVTAQFFMLGACAQTSAMKPVFPLLCHEKFVFRKTFYDIRKLKDVDRFLKKEFLYVELIQWINCDTGNVLATFKTNLSELLYPPTWNKGCAIGVDVDLLMDATRKFPGIIAPKLEVSTRTTIEEILAKYPPPKCPPVSKCSSKYPKYSCDYETHCGNQKSYHFSPKNIRDSIDVRKLHLSRESGHGAHKPRSHRGSPCCEKPRKACVEIPSCGKPRVASCERTKSYGRERCGSKSRERIHKCQPKRKPMIRQKKVCHSYEYHRAKTGFPIEKDCSCSSSSEDDEEDLRCCQRGGGTKSKAVLKSAPLTNPSDDSLYLPSQICVCPKYKKYFEISEYPNNKTNKFPECDIAGGTLKNSCDINFEARRDPREQRKCCHCPQRNSAGEENREARNHSPRRTNICNEERPKRSFSQSAAKNYDDYQFKTYCSHLPNYEMSNYRHINRKNAHLRCPESPESPESQSSAIYRRLV